MIRSYVFALIASFLLAATGNTQTDKYRFEIDGDLYLSIKKNAGGFTTIHQDNAQTSMFFGFNSGKSNIDDPMVFNSGDHNTAYGYYTLAENTSGQQNTAIGSSALINNITGRNNTGIGFGALYFGTSASNNIGIGHTVLSSNLAGSFNVAIGNDALNLTKHAERSVVIGQSAGRNDTSSMDNVYIGYGVGRGTNFATDGYNRNKNVMIGSGAGYFCKTSGNVFLGFEAGENAKANNQLYISNSDTDSLNSLIYGQFDNGLLRINGELNIDGLYSLPTSAPTTGRVLGYSGGATLSWLDYEHPWSFGAGGDVTYQNGDVGVGVANPIYRLDVNDNVPLGYVARFHNANKGATAKGIIIQAGPDANPTSTVEYVKFLDGNGSQMASIAGNGTGGIMYSTTSDRRLKQNIRTFDAGLEILDKMNPAIYQMKSNPNQDEIGFIAQELQKVLPQLVGGDPTNDVNESPMTVDYGRLTPVLVAAIKEQQDIINDLTDRINQQDKRYNELKAAISQLQGLAEK